MYFFKFKVSIWKDFNNSSPTKDYYGIVIGETIVDATMKLYQNFKDDIVSLTIEPWDCHDMILMSENALKTLENEGN